MKRAVLASIALIAGSLAFAGGVKAGLVPYFGGEYTNLYGSGTSATVHTGTNCDPNSGSCSGPAVYKYVCDGRTTDCRSNESFGTSGSVYTSECNKTVQLDVFSGSCRGDNNQWNCGDNSLIDYMVWYSGACSAPAPTAVPTAVPTIPVIVATPTPTPIVEAPAPITTQECPAGTVYGGISGSNIICVQQVQEQTQNAVANANAATGAITINVPNNNSPVIRSVSFVVPTPQVVLAATEQKTAVVTTTELPKTGLPFAAWGLTGLAPVGFGLRKFGAFKKLGADTASFIWQKREFERN